MEELSRVGAAMLADYSRLAGEGIAPEIVRGLSCAVVGLGALGSEVARLLGGMGVGRVVLIDPDTVERVNLPFSTLLRMAVSLANNGQIMSKSAGVAAAGRAIFPDTTWEDWPVEVADLAPERLAACDLIFSATDSTLARAETQLIAKLLGKPMIDGGMKGRNAKEGRVACFPAEREMACYFCQVSEARRAELLSVAVANSLGCSAGHESAAMSGTPALASVTASAMVDVGFALITKGKEGNPQVRAEAWIVRLPSAGGGWEHIQLTRSARCPWHELSGEFRLLALDVPLHMQLEADERSRKMVLELLWPLCLRAHCRICGRESEPMIRLARVRRFGQCAGCGGAGTLDPVECLVTVRATDPIAERTPEELGFSQQLFWCRPEFGSGNERNSRVGDA